MFVLQLKSCLQVQRPWYGRASCCCCWNNFSKLLKTMLVQLPWSRSKQTNGQTNNIAKCPVKTYLLSYWVALTSYPISTWSHSVPDFHKFSLTVNCFLDYKGGNVNFLQFSLCILKKSLFPFYYLISVLNGNLQCLIFEHKCKSKGKRRGNTERLVNAHSTTNPTE